MSNSTVLKMELNLTPKGKETVTIEDELPIIDAIPGNNKKMTFEFNNTTIGIILKFLDKEEYDKENYYNQRIKDVIKDKKLSDITLGDIKKYFATNWI